MTDKGLDTDEIVSLVLQKLAKERQDIYDKPIQKILDLVPKNLIHGPADVLRCSRYVNKLGKIPSPFSKYSEPMEFFSNFKFLETIDPPFSHKSYISILKCFFSPETLERCNIISEIDFTGQDYVRDVIGLVIGHVKNGRDYEKMFNEYTFSLEDCKDPIKCFAYINGLIRKTDFDEREQACRLIEKLKGYLPKVLYPLALGLKSLPDLTTMSVRGFMYTYWYDIREEFGTEFRENNMSYITEKPAVSFSKNKPKPTKKRKKKVPRNNLDCVIQTQSKERVLQSKKRDSPGEEAYVNSNLLISDKYNTLSIPDYPNEMPQYNLSTFEEFNEMQQHTLSTFEELNEMPQYNLSTFEKFNEMPQHTLSTFEKFEKMPQYTLSIFEEFKSNTLSTLQGFEEMPQYTLSFFEEFKENPQYTLSIFKEFKEMPQNIEDFSENKINIGESICQEKVDSNPKERMSEKIDSSKSNLFHCSEKDLEQFNDGKVLISEQDIFDCEPAFQAGFTKKDKELKLDTNIVQNFEEILVTPFLFVLLCFVFLLFLITESKPFLYVIKTGKSVYKGLTDTVRKYIQIGLSFKNLSFANIQKFYAHISGYNDVPFYKHYIHLLICLAKSKMKFLIFFGIMVSKISQFSAIVNQNMENEKMDKVMISKNTLYFLVLNTMYFLVFAEHAKSSLGSMRNILSYRRFKALKVRNKLLDYISTWFKNLKTNL